MEKRIGKRKVGRRERKGWKEGRKEKEEVIKSNIGKHKIGRQEAERGSQEGKRGVRGEASQLRVAHYQSVPVYRC